MASISLCMIVRDEEAVLARCLDSVKDIVDEIVIVDTGSVDDTKNIASRYTDKIYDFEWIDDFSAARNFSFSKATMDYILWLDADDIITPENQDKIKALKKVIIADAVLFTYNYGGSEDGNRSYVQLRERLIRRDIDPEWVGVIHEYIPLPENMLIRDDICIDHKSIKKTSNKRNLDIFEKYIAAGNELTLREKYLYGRELVSADQEKKAADILEECLADEKLSTNFILQASLTAASCRITLGQNDRAEVILKNCLEKIKPVPELFYTLGYSLMEQNKLDEAIEAYLKAIRCKRDETFYDYNVNLECSDFLPYIRLCECYLRKGDKKSAEYYNNKAAEIKPDDPFVKKNRIRISLRMI